jgi:hypothetical protein
MGAELSGLMGAAGNRAVGRLVRSLQRVDYTQPVTNVSGTGITRLEVRKLKYGIDDFQTDYGTDSPSDERNKTKESPSHMAVVLVPDTLDLDQPVQVILHFHGWVFRKGDPYAGYLVAAKGSSAPGGTVRDVDQEHWEQQMASLAGVGPQVVAILAQGRGKSEFGSFPTFEYVRDVLEKSGRPELAKLADSENYSVVLSAHSGGGSTKVVPMLGRGDADTADRAALPAGVADATAHRVIDKHQPVDLVVLYEALNGDGDVAGVMKWVKAQIARLVPRLDATSGTASEQALAATPVLRGYYGARKVTGYRERYRWLACLINDEIKASIPAPFRQAVSDRFRIIEVAAPTPSTAKDAPTGKDPPKPPDVEHEQVIAGPGPSSSSGSLADALRAARDPTRDRAQAVLPSDEECAELKKKARARAEAAAAAAKARDKEKVAK